MNQLNRTKQIITGTSFIAFPLLFIIGNAIHSDIFSLEMIHNAEEWMHEIHGNKLQQIGNLLELSSAPFLIIMAISFINTTNKKGWQWGLIGGLMVFIGSVSLAANKGAFCLSVAGFDTLPDADYQQIIPAFQSLFAKNGLLKVTLTLPLLPLGFVVQSIGLLKGKYIPQWQSILVLSGSLLMANLGIELFNLMGAIVLLIAFSPISMRLINNKDTEVKSF